MFFLHVIIAIISLLALVVIHELGHFLMAKRLGVKVEEFGIGIPPRIFGKKIGETIYSLNLLPIGAFVKMYGEDEQINDERSFSQKSIFQRSLIILAGVAAFWIVAFLILTFMATMKLPALVGDEDHVEDAKVMVFNLEPDMAANQAGIQIGDIIHSLSKGDSYILANRIGDVSSFLYENKGEEILATIDRNGNIYEILLSSNDERGVMGFHIARVALKSYPWYQAPYQGALMTGRLTYRIVTTLGDTAIRAITGKPLPDEVRFAGPVGIVTDVFVGALESGFQRYLEIIVMISISLAIFNLLPIPALDGGRFLFLMIEKIKGSPLNQKVEQGLIAISFIMLIGLFILVTFYDIKG